VSHPPLLSFLFLSSSFLHEEAAIEGETGLEWKEGKHIMTWIVIKAGALMGQIPEAGTRKEGRKERKKTFFVQVHIIGVLKSGLKWFQSSTS
jgi:hypothetical protein